MELGEGVEREVRSWEVGDGKEGVYYAGGGKVKEIRLG